jgi:diketogulonate reductase-like aldo/keto reductase
MKIEPTGEMMPQTLSLTSTVKLNNNVEMPVLGLGTFQSERGNTTQNAVRWALEAGYRHIDTAAIYHNEQDVGVAIHDSSIPRSEVFVTTKLWNSDHRFDSALRAFDRSLEMLGMEYVDLYLVHWPVPPHRAEAWRALLRLYEEGRCRAIGISNYLVRHLQEILVDTPVIPTVNQFELSPFLTRTELVNFCQAQGIQVESYSPLARGTKLKDPSVGSIAAQHGKTPAQVLIRWALQKGVVVIPKSVHQERIIENASVFDFSLTPEEIALLDGLDEEFQTIRPSFMRGEWD